MHSELGRKVRCVLGMMASDKHSKGIRALAMLFRDHGLEVVYVGEHNTAETLASVALSEDADFVGVSFSTGSYLTHMRHLRETLDRLGGADIDILVGGLIHPEDVAALRELGVAGVFGPGSTIPEILTFVDTSFPSGARAHEVTATPAP